ncbi:MAG TPA: hypothetical protein VJW76_02685 [Verrucomicrobiae bacterium]|nr:hypothetical protein [Verrucomicrobiae bacterium]
MTESLYEVEESTITERTALSKHSALVNTRGKPVDEDRLIAALQRNPSGSKVESLCVSQTSLVRTLAVAAPLRNLRFIRISSRQLRDYQALQALPGLIELDVAVQRRLVSLPDLTHSNIAQLGIGPTLQGETEMIGRMRSLRVMVLMYVWPESTLQALNALNLTVLEIKTSTISEIGELDCSKLAFFACRGCARLVSVHGVDAEKVDIDTCRKLNLNTLSGKRINVLGLRGQKRIDDMEFLKNCPNLKELEVAATRLSSDCVPQIAAVKQLTRAELYGFALDKKDLQRLSSLAKNTVVTDGLNTFRGGLEVAGK